MSDGPSGRGLLSPIETNFTLNVYEDPWEAKQRSPQRNQFETPSFTSPVGSLNTRPFDITPSAPAKNSRARNEVRKLLSHVLIQLANRTKPPSVVDVITNVTRDSNERGIGALAETLKDVVKRGGRDRKTDKSKSNSGPPEDDSDDENDAAFTTDITINLMTQLKDVLTMAIDQGWQIFNDSHESQSAVEQNSKTPSSTFRKSRNSFKTGGKMSRSSSPHKGQDQIPELLSLCISILESIVAEDCRYRVASPRPSQPPNTLQFMTLNIAQFLIYSHRHDPRVISEIAFAMIPAFYTFNPQMHPRLVLFFESSVIRVILYSLARLQGTYSQEPRLETSNDPFSAVPGESEFPIVSIQIDEVHASDGSPQVQDDWTSTSVTRSLSGEVQSTNNPRQSSHVYYLAFIIPPLISAILDSIESPNIETETAQVTSLLRAIATSKIDTYNDLLEIIAYRGPKSRRFAIASLAELWPKSVGHAVLSSPFCPINVPGISSSKPSHNHHCHQFIPWYFESNNEHTRTDGIFHDDCRSCLNPARGFSLMCPSCMTVVHFDCYDYPEGNYTIQYSMQNDRRVQGIAMCRFSEVHTNAKLAHGELIIHRHSFTPANWFTLCLCFVCQKPLWGCFAQGLKCGQCPTALHLKCLPLLSMSKQCGTFELSSEVVTIDWSLLRQSCIEHFPVLHCTLQELQGNGYEEIQVYHSVLRTQLQILNNGIAFGSVVVHNGKNTSQQMHNDFELHNVVKQTEQLLDSQRLAFSPLTQQYMQDSNNNIVQNAPSIMFNWSFLEYITATIKTSSPQSHHTLATTSDFLNVEQPHDIFIDVESASLPYESATLMHIRGILGADFALRSDDAAKFILDHLHHLAFFDRMDGNPYPFQDIAMEKNLKCIFPLPLGLDLSMNVETLVSSIEASLADLDLSTNEFGFLLLTRKFWPNGLASEYGLKRLAVRVLSWILAEDDNLAIILREFVAKQRKLPGVRSDPQPWPSSPGARSGSTNLASNGGDFVSARRALLSRFALPWLSALHNLDPVFYGQIVFDTCCQVAEDSNIQFQVTDLGNRLNKTENQNLTHCDEIMRSITKLAQCSVIFTVFDDIFLRWADFAYASDIMEQAIPSLHRLFHDNEVAQSTTVISPDLSSNTADSSQHSFINPLRAISNFASQSEIGLPRTLCYLPMIIKSGVTVPIPTFKHFLTLITASKRNSLENANVLVRAILLSLWLRSTGRQNLQDLIASLHSALSSQISQCLVSGENPAVSLSIIRQSLAACLRIYGCDRANIIASGMVSTVDVEHLPSRRKLTTRGSVSEDPIVVHPELLNALDLYVQSKVDDVTCHVAKFLNMFLTESPFLEAFEIDNFILRNGKIIASCVWATYNIQREDVAVARTSLLLRSLLIDPEPFEEVLATNMDPAVTSTSQRLSSITRLFRMISDVTSPAFDVEGRQWRSSVIEVFNFYFSALWADPSEEVRVAVKSSSAALLPIHFEIISQCWSESLSKAPITERTRLVTFLIQLRAHFSTWKVLSWNRMIETLAEYDYDPKALQDHLTVNDHVATAKTMPDYRLSTADPEMVPLRVSVILLGLQMIGDGIEIDSFSLMKLKIQLVQIAGFNSVSVIPTQSRQSFRLQFSEVVEVSEAAYPCIEELIHVVDAPHYLRVPKSALGIADNHEDEVATVLVGSVFLDVTLCVLGTLPKLSSLPVLTLKCLLETLYIIIHKYDFGDAIFYHLQPLLRRAILRSSELLSQDLSYELRQLSLSIAQTSITKWHTFLGPTISIILENVASEITSQAQNSQDSLIVHGKLLIGNTLQMFCNNGLLLSLLRRPLQPSFFNVLHQIFYAQAKDSKSIIPTTTCDPLLRDTLSRAAVVECDPQSFQTVLQNISSFIEIVYFQGYSPDLMAFCGQHLSLLARRMSDGSMEGLDSSPLITISSVLIQNNRRHSRDLLSYVEVVLRVALNRLGASEASLRQLIKAVVPNKPKAQGNPGSVDLVNVLFDILLDGLRMKTKMHSLTIKSLVQSLSFAEKSLILPPSQTQRQTFRNMTDDAYNFLQNHPWNEENIDNDFQAVTAAGKLLLGEVNRDPTHFQRFTEPAMDARHGLDRGCKSSRHPLTMRSWNILLLVTLQQMEDDWKSMIYDHFHSFSGAYSSMLRTYVSSGISSPLTATTDINQAHISLRLWLMLVHSISANNHNGETAVVEVWNELWPPFESFLVVLETEARAGLSPALVSLASTSVADLLIYLRSLNTSLSLDTSAHIAILNRLRALNRGDSSSNKITRALRSMAELPVHVASNVLLDQIAKELVAAEKIRIIETSGRVQGRG